MDTYRLARRYAAVLVGSILVFTVLYSVGMGVFEGRPRSLLRSFQVVMQTLTTIGYGGDSPWQSTPMLVLVVTMQLATLLLIFSAFPAVVVPVLEESLSRTPPAAREDLSEHVVVCTATTHTESLIDELTDRDVPYVIVEPDRETATDLFERDRAVVHGDPTSMATLADVNVGEARALVSDAEDKVDVSIITAAKELAPELPVYSVVTDEDFVEYHERAGAERAVLPRKLLGSGIANKVRNTVETSVESGLSIGEDIEIAEIPVAGGSELDGTRLTEDGIVGPAGADDRSRTPYHVIGVWARGQFHVPPFEGVALDDQSVLLVAGRSVTLSSLARSAGSQVTQYGRGRVLVAGSGLVGTMVSDALLEDGIDQTVIDLERKGRVDVVGDVTEETTFEEAGIEDARTVVLALDDDTITLVAAFVVGALAPDVEVVARANRTESVPKLYSAGVDYALALSTVAGRLLAAAILDSDQSIALDEEVRLVRRDPGPLEGGTLGEADLRERVGCSVVAIERRDGRVDADLREWTEIAAGDHLFVAGTDAALDRLDAILSPAESGSRDP